MPTTMESFAPWLQDADIREATLTTEQRLLLQAACRFRQQQGTDYYSTRLLGHFLLHCGCGLPVAQIARLLGISRPTASRQQGVSSKEAIRQAHHRMDGRSYGKLLPRFAGPIAQYLVANPQATRADLLDFIDRTFEVRVCRVALFHFLKKYGLQSIPYPPPAAATASVDLLSPPAADTSSIDLLTPPPSAATLPATPALPPPFSSDARSMREPSSS
jgi:hypothetical protein